MAKDTFWFKHETGANRSKRMRKMQHIYGHWGKGIYWDVIEMLREENEYRHPMDEQSIAILCDLIGCKDIEKFSNWLQDCFRLNLLQHDDSCFYSDKLIDIMHEWEVKKNNGNQGGRPKNNPNETELITETKPNHKPNTKAKRNHKNIEDKNNKIIVMPSPQMDSDSSPSAVLSTHPLLVFVRDNLPTVSKLRSQLTEKEADALLSRFPKPVIKDVLESMENHANLLKKYKSVYLTTKNWCGNRQPTIVPTIQGETLEQRQLRLREANLRGE